ncbi:helix-turn-helix domain-containing protein [uncultured Tateyamaria sp.]|uniref:winged helix-turn-helix transcriptional regulator n=1 Tax=Tateyamaria sp. 1078 TaxID=3417464 RepID=UPI00262C2A56|nr:helix-turn-helix domain-containing protein [uncultured Tateyamaria sp.]
MTKTDRAHWNGCPTRYAAGIVGDKWCFLLMRDVLLHGKRTYSEFLSGPEGISTNILADRLSRLERNGLLDRRTDPRKGSRVCYFPTRKLRDLLPALLAMMVWSVKYDADTEAPDSFAASFVADPAATIAWYEADIDRVDQDILGAPAE